MGKFYRDLEREYLLKSNGVDTIVKIYKGYEIYSKFKKSEIDYSVCYGAEEFSLGILKLGSCSEDFFYVSPFDSRKIVRCAEYDDLWYGLCVGKVRHKTYKLVEGCLRELLKGFNDSSVMAFIRLEDGFYHLFVDGVDYGFLGSEIEDLGYKVMLTAVFKDIKGSVDVIVFPSNSGVFFSDNVALYKSIDDFYSSLKSRKYDSFFKTKIKLYDSI